MNKRVGPLTIWQWGIIGAVIVVAGFLYYRKRQQDQQNAQAPLIAVGPGSYGLGTIVGYPQANMPAPVQPPGPTPLPAQAPPPSPPSPITTDDQEEQDEISQDATTSDGEPITQGNPAPVSSPPNFLGGFIIDPMLLDQSLLGV